MHVYQHVLPYMQAEAADTFSLLIHNQRSKVEAANGETAETEIDEVTDCDASEEEDDR